MAKTTSLKRFVEGLVFGFDVGTGSIGYAVRKGREFKKVGVLICPEEIGDLSTRRTLRRQRRTLRSRKYRRQWLAQELEKLGFPRPWQPPQDPITLRLRALRGEVLEPHEVHAAIAHLLRRRGYSEVPWANREAERPEGKAEESELGQIRTEVAGMKQRLDGRHPCEYLAQRREEIGKSPTEKWARKIYWPRECLEKEFRAIVAAQERHFPKLAAKADWLLFGDARPIRKNGALHRVYYNAKGSRNPGALALRWPRFDNRGPALDSFQPLDEQGRPRHVVRKNKEAFRRAQWELALMNFRVLDAHTRQKLDPRAEFPEFIEKLRNEWVRKGKVTKARLAKIAEPFKERFALIENQPPLTPEKGSGRARYSSPTLEEIQRDIDAGNRVDPPQPVLLRAGENRGAALNRFIADTRHPLVRHRLVLFGRVLDQLLEEFGEPDMIVVEAVRSLAFGQKRKNELNKRNEEFRKDREHARGELRASNESVSGRAIQRYRLWREAGGYCPFCVQPIERTDLGHGADIEHLVPRAKVDCNEFFNLTVAHVKCNRERKLDRTPFEAFANTPEWDKIRANAEKVFRGLKRAVFLSSNAEELIEEKADLQHTAYIARAIRHLTLIRLGWLDEDGRDPTPQSQNAALAFQVTNGQLTSRLRKAWGLNQTLHPLPAGVSWEDLPEADQKLFAEKNRGDLRHHALDAMVIACTLPWLAHRTHGATDGFGNHGWWTQDEKQRSKAANPVFPGEGQMNEVVRREIEGILVRQHVSRSDHQQSYGTTLYSKKGANIYVARERFVSLKPKDLGNIWPAEFADYCRAAWQMYSEESPDIDAELRKSRGCLPEEFTARLCFAHFQKWRARDCPPFGWPTGAPRIPIRSVRLISVNDDRAVASASPGTRAYVKRTRFKEVRIYPALDGKGLAPVFVPSWRGEHPIGDVTVVPGVRPVAVIRRGQIVKMLKSTGPKNPPGYYRVWSTMREQIRLIPAHLANDKETLLAAGYLANGVSISWKTFCDAFGYELPHPSPSEPEPSRSAKA